MPGTSVTPESAGDISPSVQNMALPRAAFKNPIAPLLALLLVAWIIELCGVLFLHKSCDASILHPGEKITHSCLRQYRFIWFVVFLELPVAVGLLAALFGTSTGDRAPVGYAFLHRYRLGFIGLLATATALQMYACNEMLNLVDSWPLPGHSTEVLRAKVATIGFAILSTFNVLLMFALGDDSGSAAELLGRDVDEPLLNGVPRP
ncbi:hypothetical protein WJX72_004037 [[Myrmecia] bisecta]|uniref:Uncharacterized protein n=1 Tax=[Myrmecia] bisecta TaxID=41462 RepID=A0AAW1PFD1_9CHLO